MIKTIIFDNGGVLVSGNENGAYALFSSAYGASEEDVKIEYEWCAKKLDSGEITSPEFYHKLEEIFGKSIPFEEIKAAHRGCFIRQEDVFQYAKSLKTEHELALLSNFGDYFDEFNQDWHLEELFDKDKMFVSCKLGMIKPNQDIYLEALRRLGRKPEETVFIDDRADNIETARSLGMNVVQFNSLEQLKNDLEKVLKANEK